MVVLIALLTGISDVAALGAIFGVNAAMILFGLLMEHYESPGRPHWLSFLFGCLAGAVPWILIAVYLWSPGVAAEPPAFVYGIFFSLFVFFNVLRGEHGAAVPAGGEVARLPVRGDRLRVPQPDRQVAARLAGVRRHPGS